MPFKNKKDRIKWYKKYYSKHKRELDKKATKYRINKKIENNQRCKYCNKLINKPYIKCSKCRKKHTLKLIKDLQEKKALQCNYAKKYYHKNKKKVKKYGEKYRKTHKYQLKIRQIERKEKRNNRCPDCNTLILPRSKRCGSCARRGKRHPNYKGKSKKNGYIIIPHKYPGNNKLVYILEHRLVMELCIGRRLKSSEIVHHINGKRKDNRIENLMLYANKKAHHYHKSFICKFCNQDQRK